MKIKGLGEKTLEKLDDYINDIVDIYELTPEILYPIVGEKVGAKLLQEIDKSKTVYLATFIAAFSIPLFGNTAASQLSRIDFEYLEEITYKDLRSVGIGDKAAINFIDWLQKDWIDKYCNLPISIIKSSKAPAKQLGTVVITGTFEESRNVLGDRLRQLGFDVKDSISSKTKFLLVGGNKGQTSKTMKAQQLNIEIVYSVEELLQKANLE
jgi:NAD-dependent DNA ligase